MTPQFRLASIALSAVAVMSLAACGSKPKPEPAMPQPAAQPTAPSTPPPAPQQRPTTPPSAPVAQGPIPGSVQEFVLRVGDRVYFDYESYAVRSDARSILDAQAAWLSRYPQVTIRIEGNADERGTLEYNFGLGARRANALRDYLVSRGVASGRISTVSYGKSRPIDPRSNEEGWAINRNGHTTITGGAR